MPRVKQADVPFQILGEYRKCSVVVFVNANGEFYCNVPTEADPYFEISRFYRDGKVDCRKGRNGKQIFAGTMDDLLNELSVALKKCHEPEVVVENVIRFNIESHISFATTPEGEIVPNGYWAKDTQWESDNGYGGHHAIKPAKNGYSLTVGAMAMTKTTRTFGKAVKISYENYYKGSSHLGVDNPAQKLNSWCSFSLPDDCREMPYSDDAAMFFFDLMMGMAKLSRMIQENTRDDDQILELIQTRNSGLLGYTSEGNT